MDYILQNVKSKFVSPIYIKAYTFSDNIQYYQDDLNKHSKKEIVHSLMCYTELVSSGKFKLIAEKMLSRFGLNINDKFCLDGKIVTIQDKYINEDESITYIISDKTYEPDEESHKNFILKQMDDLKQQYNSQGIKAQIFHWNN
jgi:hypothetical protein